MTLVGMHLICIMMFQALLNIVRFGIEY
jgi:hypothetical protein